MRVSKLVRRSKRGVDVSGEQWWIIGLFILGIMTLLFFMWVLVAAKVTEEGIFDFILKLFGR